MTRRRLKPEEMELWRQVAEKADPLERPQTFDPGAYAPKVNSQKPALPQKISPREFNLHGKAPPKPAARKTNLDLMPPLAHQLHQTPVEMDKKTFAKMNRGKLIPEGRIDLHGMTMDRAHGALSRFIMTAHSNGKRLVLVITGKGKLRDDEGPIPVQFGVLRHQVPQWLKTAPLSSVVMQINQAHIRHGGGGAYYVYLRRQR
ncbi:MAG: Smr/MutS family protein [Roseobacter sp.]